MTGSPPPPSLKLLRPLGSDAQSETYLAEVGGFPAPLVARLLRPEVARDGARVDPFLAETQRLSAVSSPALLQVRGAGRMSDGRVFVLTDFAEGPRLASQGQLPLDSLVELGAQLAEALKALHESGLVVGKFTAQQVVLTGQGPRLDVSLAGLSRAPGATEASDVSGLATLLLGHAGPASEKNPFEVEVRRGIGAATTAAELLGAFGAVRQRWASDTRVSAKKPAETGATAPDAEPDLTGQRLGPYQLQRMLGQGAMGRVYLGKHTRIGREAAIKVLRADHAEDKDLVQRFIQEATAVSAIKNEHIVEVHDFGEEPTADGGTRVFCVMEVLEGHALSEEIKLGRMGVQRACRIALQVAQALGAAHALGVVHRDVKPENIFLHHRHGDRDFVKVLDFGVAKLLKPLASMPTSSTQAGMIIGTPEYMAPEQALGISTDLRTDLYAVGLVLYELLAGTRPFQGETFGQLVVQITTTAPPPLPAKTPTGEPMPARVGEIIARCLEKKPEARWADAAELCAALEPFAHTGNSLVELPAVRERSKAPRIAAVIAAVAMLGAGAWLAFRPVPSPVPPPVAVVVPPPVVAPPPVAVVAPVPPTPPPPEVPPAVVTPPPAAVVKPPVATPLKRLTGKDVGRVFAGSQAKLRACLFDHRALLPSKEGQLMLTFTVLDSGAVSKATLTTPGFEGVISDCVVKRLKDLHFPRTLEPEVTFELPLAYVFKD